MTLRNPSSFHPGQYLGDELEHRGLTNASFSNLAGLGIVELIEVLHFGAPLTDDHCEKIAKALGMSPNTWRRLQAAWDKECRR